MQDETVDAIDAVEVKFRRRDAEVERRVRKPQF